MRLLRKLIFCLLAVTAAVLAPPLFSEAGPHDKILLTWSPLENVVTYEVEVATVPVSDNRAPAPARMVAYDTTQVAAPGIEIDRTLFDGGMIDHLYYRVRPLGLDKRPLGPFSEPRRLAEGTMNPARPYTTANYYGRPVLLYPAYSWIPVLGASRYKVEVLNRQPDNPSASAAASSIVNTYMVEGWNQFDCYDFYPYVDAGTYYWRVLALDDSNNPVGSYSVPVPFTVSSGPYRFAALGDSITHGGGAVSSPPSDRRYDYTSYLPFPVKNLGKSGDTIDTTVERFDHDVLPFKPKYLFILAGSNSLRGGEPAENIIAGLETLNEKCRANDIVPIFLTLPPVNPDQISVVFGEETADGWQERQAEVNAFIRKQNYVVDIAPLLTDEHGLLPVQYATDGLHYDIPGKKIIAREILRYTYKIGLVRQ
ncbi:MAG: GDSL-type esterase/lipase family protein [Negativicutes bacterium]|nr:GDSL-type esterase/lipase family protein [Negativicutes bacterium]